MRERMKMMTEGASAIRIFDRGMPAPVEFEGERIGFGTSRRPGSAKWAEIEIYRLPGGGYMTHRIGRSLVYHRGDTWCKTVSGAQPGHPAFLEDLPSGAVRCPECMPNPLAILNPEEPVRYEFPRHTFDSCKDAREVVAALTLVRSRDGQAPGVRFSGPVQSALRQASEYDEDIYEIIPGSLLG